MFTLAITGLGAAGWLLVAAVFVGCSASVPALARWAERTRREPRHTI